MTKLQRYNVLFAMYIFCIVASELMGSKTFALPHTSWMHLNASVGIFLIPIVYSVNDIIVEVYGKARARGVVLCGLLAVCLVFVFAAVATALPASKHFLPSEGAYDAIFKSSLRIAAASLTAFAIAEVADVLIFVKIREKLGKQALWLRNNVSNFVAQFLDTTIFITLAFYVVGNSFHSNVSFLVSLILPYWLLKCALSVVETPLVYAGVKWLKAK